jgi:hypothetical protein
MFISATLTNISTSYVLIKDLGTSSIHTAMHKVALPLDNFANLVVVGDKVAIVFDRMICYWNARTRTLGTFKIAKNAKTFDLVMLHPTLDAFLTATWTISSDIFGGYLSELITTTFAFDTHHILSMTRTPLELPRAYRFGHKSRLEYQSCYKDSIRHVTACGVVDCLDGSDSALAHLVIEHNFQKDKVFIKTLNVPAFIHFTGKLPSDLDSLWIPGGLLSFIHPKEVCSHVVYHLNEADIHKAIVIPDYGSSDNSVLPVPRNYPSARHAFADEDWHVIVFKWGLQVWSYNEELTMACPDAQFRQMMFMKALTRSAQRKQLRDFLAAAEGLQRPQRFLLED